jgi:hypothetical protein
MRHTPLTSFAVVLVLAAAASTAVAGETRNRRRAPDPYPELTLPVAEVSAAIEPWTPDVRGCWVQHAPARARASGHLRLELVVDPVGMVWQHRLVYARPRSRPLDRCLGKVIAQLRFPMRRGYTMAAIPFLFRASTGPGTRPIMSCERPRGCRRQRQP